MDRNTKIAIAMMKAQMIRAGADGPAIQVAVKTLVKAIQANPDLARQLASVTRGKYARTPQRKRGGRKGRRTKQRHPRSPGAMKGFEKSNF